MNSLIIQVFFFSILTCFWCDSPWSSLCFVTTVKLWFYYLPAFAVIAMAHRAPRVNPYLATSDIETASGPQRTSWYAGPNRIPAGRTPLPDRPVLIIADYSPLQELTHRSEPDHELFAAMTTHNLRNTTAGEFEALFTYARLMDTAEITSVQIQQLRPLMVIRLRTQWGIQMLASDLEFRYADLTGDVFRVPNDVRVRDLLNEYRSDWRHRQYNYIQSDNLIPGTIQPFILRLQCHKVRQGIILP